MGWQQNGTDLPSEEPPVGSIDTGAIHGRHQASIDREQMDKLKARVAELEAMLAQTVERISGEKTHLAFVDGCWKELN